VIDEIQWVCLEITVSSNWCDVIGSFFCFMPADVIDFDDLDSTGVSSGIKPKTAVCDVPTVALVMVQ
jgi:hypothetical protein